MGEHWLAIRNGNVIETAGEGEPRTEDVIVRDNRIVAVGDDSVDGLERPPIETIEQIDATGLTVMPGLIDAHCHMTYGEANTEEEIDLYTTHELRTLIAAANAEKVLRAGVTSISQPGGSYYIGVGLREGLKRKLISGPRIHTAGRYLTTSNGLTDWYPSSVGVPEGSIGTLTNTPDEMLREIRVQVKNGVDFVKLADSPHGEYQAFRNDELKMVADLCHQLGKACTIHARGPKEVNAAVEAGFDWIMHGNVMTDEVIDKLAASDSILVPTILLLANQVDWPELTGAPQKAVTAIRKMLEKTADSLHRAHAAGVKFAMGTDTGFAITPYGEWHAREIELLMTYAGLSAGEALAAATRGGARTVGLEGELGEIRPGYLADVITVEGDPTKNIRVLANKHNIRHVVKDGVLQEFSHGLDERRYAHDSMPIVYSTNGLTFDMVCRGERSPSFTVAPWTASMADDLLTDIERLGREAPAEGSR
jgi:imidazolonepropionase-like amidohydrolase